MIKRIGKLIVKVGIVAMASCALFLSGSSAQAQGTISDYGTYVVFEFANGDTSAINKENVSLITSRGDYVRIYGSQFNWGNRPMLELVAGDLSYTNAYDLRKALECVFFGYDYETYINVVGTTQIDTVKYWDITESDTIARLFINYNYTGASSDTIASKTILPQ